MSDLIVSPVPPDLRTVLDNLKADILYNLNCHQLGVIESFDAAKQTASIQLSVLRVVGNEEIPYPLLTDCPIMFPAAGGAYMTFPVVQGDPCLVLFNDRDIDNWFTTGNVVAPNTSRAHSLSDGIAILGIRSLANPPPYTANDAVVLALGGASVSITTAGVVRMTKGSGYVEVSAAGVPKLHGSNGAEVIADNKVAILANSASLRTGMEQLCDVLTNFKDTAGHTPNAATLVNIAAMKLYFQTLLSS